MKTEELIQKLHDHPRSTEVLLLFNEDSPTPVSYTHLDVYKRQAKSCRTAAEKEKAREATLEAAADSSSALRQNPGCLLPPDR